MRWLVVVPLTLAQFAIASAQDLDQRHLLSFLASKTVSELRERAGRLRHKSMLEEKCIWQLRYQSLPTACYQVNKAAHASERTLASLLPICLRAVESIGSLRQLLSSARNLELPAPCRKRAEERYQDLIYKEGRPDVVDGTEFE